MSGENVVQVTTGRVLRACLGPFLILAAAVYFYYLACSIGPCPPGQLGADFWPKMILIFLMIGCVIKFGEIISNRQLLDVKADARPEMHNGKLTAMIVLLIVTVFSIDYIGFALANVCFMLIFLYLVGLRRLRTLLLISLIGTTALLYIFVKLVYLPLPRGMGFFEDITLFIYRALYIM